VVANVASGPGTHPEAEWSNVIHAARLRGTRVLGYVATGYLGSLPHPNGLPTRSGTYGTQAWLSQIESEIDEWYQFYGNDLGGVFLDEGTSACGPTSGSDSYSAAYQSIRDHLRADHPDAITVLNPGLAVPKCYQNAADVLVTFEGSYDNYTGASDSQGQAYKPLSWTPADPNQIWHIVYGATTIDLMDNAMALSNQRRAGYVYITDAGLPNPFGTLPLGEYWALEVANLTP
jgi:hypothetical protein